MNRLKLCTIAMLLLGIVIALPLAAMKTVSMTTLDARAGMTAYSTSSGTTMAHRRHHRHHHHHHHHHHQSGGIHIRL